MGKLDTVQNGKGFGRRPGKEIPDEDWDRIFGKKKKETITLIEQGKTNDGRVYTILERDGAKYMGVAGKDGESDMLYVMPPEDKRPPTFANLIATDKGLVSAPWAAWNQGDKEFKPAKWTQTKNV